MAEAFFVVHGDQVLPSALTRGPWSPDHQHGGPPAALLGRTLARAVGDDFHVVRVTVEFVRPVALVASSIEAGAPEGGRRVRRASARLVQAGREVARATAVAVRRAHVPLPDLPMDRAEAPRPPETCAPFEFPFFRDAVGYHTAVEVRFARGEFGKGPTHAWIRLRVPLVEGEVPTALERTLVAADSGNGVSPVVDPARYAFVNPDLTVHVDREAVGEWIGLDAETTLRESGVGLARTRLWDARGTFGSGVQSLVLNER